MDFAPTNDTLPGWDLAGTNAAEDQTIATKATALFNPKAGMCTASGFMETAEDNCSPGYHPYTLFNACACWKSSKKWTAKHPDYAANKAAAAAAGADPAASGAPSM